MKKITLPPWPNANTAQRQKFLSTAEAIYRDWMKRGVTSNVAIAFLACAERVSQLDVDRGLYRNADEKKPAASVHDQNEVAWSELQKSPELGLRHVLAAKSTGEAALALTQFWLRPDDADYDRIALMAERWVSHGDLTPEQPSPAPQVTSPIKEAAPTAQKPTS